MKTSELTDAALDWAVAKAEGAKGVRLHTYQGVDPGPPVWVIDWEFDWGELGNYCPSSDWSYGGPIIEREGIELRYWGLHSVPWKASIDGDTDAGVVLYEEHGTTPLIAAMRCFVASKLGDNIDIPKELT